MERYVSLHLMLPSTATDCPGERTEALIQVWEEIPRDTIG